MHRRDFSMQDLQRASRHHTATCRLSRRYRNATRTRTKTRRPSRKPLGNRKSDLKGELLQQRRTFSDDGAVNEGGGHTILMNMFKFFRRSVLVAVAVALLAWAPSSQARVTRIILDPPSALTGQDIPYERIAGRAWGELDPSDPQNALITDIALAPKKANGK